MTITAILAAVAAATSLNGEWQFAKYGAGRAPASAAEVLPERWRTVRVPHDWAIEGPFDPYESNATGCLPSRADGWYRRKFSVSAASAAAIAAGGRAYLSFDGVMARPRVYVNGRDAGGWDYGYMGFTLDVTEFVKEGENDLAVFASTRHHWSRWYSGGGIYRDVALVVKTPDSLVPGSLAITTPEATAVHAKVHVEYRLDRSGAKTLDFEVEKPRRWSPDDPYLYELEVAGERFRYGIRSFAFTADSGLVLNGSRLQLRGVNLHSDLGILGMAFDRDAARRQLAIMKDMGANALRTSHNAPASALLDLCDEMGFVVWDECFDRWNAFAGRRQEENLEDYCTRNLVEFVRRDRNHPSVFVWSIGNEIPLADEKDPDGVTRERCRLFREAVRREDATRPVGIGECFTEAITNSVLDDLDITGWNYARKYALMKRQYPAKPVVYSESASALSDYGFYANPPSGQRTGWNVAERMVDSYDHNAAPWSDIPDVEFARMEADGYCAGEFVWTGIDYLGEPTPYISWFTAMKGIPPAERARSSYFGIVDLTGVPKDRFYLYRSHWIPIAPTVHILPHWNWAERAAKADGRLIVPVFVYGSGDEAELFLNGRSLGVRRKEAVRDYPLDLEYPQDDAVQFVSAEPGDWRTNRYYDICARYRFRWAEVPYEPGELRAVVRRGGMDVAADVMRTAGRPVAVRLTEDPYNAPGSELRFVQVDLVDERGVRDPLSSARVSFSCTGGEIAAVGNGDPRGMESFAYVKSHRLYFGKAVAAVRIGAGGEAMLTASLEGLEDAVIRLCR